MTIHRQPRVDQGPIPTLRYGDHIGDYVINGFAGTGATSYVYRARRSASFEPVAVKVLHPHLVNDEVKRRRFIREAEMMLRLRHPNIVTFHEILEVDGHLAFVMEYIDGWTLEDFRDHVPDVDELTLSCLFVDLLRGLHLAHRAGIIHRDLKPANVLITEVEGRLVGKIIDFGVARFADRPLEPEDKAKIVGTAAYISPEEVRDPEEVCAASDIYSVGVMLYEAACGRRPFESLEVREVMQAHVHELPPSPREHNPRLSSGMEDVIMRTLAKTPDTRFDSALALIFALEQASRSVENPDNVDVNEILEEVPTFEWSRDELMDPAQARPFFLLLRQAMIFAVTFFATTGVRGGGDDPHWLNRNPGSYLP